MDPASVPPTLHPTFARALDAPIQVNVLVALCDCARFLQTTKGRSSAELFAALDELYAYYERNEQMLGNALRDAEVHLLARQAVAPLLDYLEKAAEVLAAGRPARGRGRRLLEGALCHALSFSTWQSLAGNGIGRSEAAEIVTAFVDAAARHQPGAPSRRRSSP